MSEWTCLELVALIVVEVRDKWQLVTPESKHDQTNATLQVFCPSISYMCSESMPSSHALISSSMITAPIEPNLHLVQVILKFSYTYGLHSGHCTSVNASHCIPTDESAELFIGRVVDSLPPTDIPWCSDWLLLVFAVGFLQFSPL